MGRLLRLTEKEFGGTISSSLSRHTRMEVVIMFLHTTREENAPDKPGTLLSPDKSGTPDSLGC